MVELDCERVMTSPKAALYFPANSYEPYSTYCTDEKRGIVRFWCREMSENSEQKTVDLLIGAGRAAVG